MSQDCVSYGNVYIEGQRREREEEWKSVEINDEGLTTTVAAIMRCTSVSLFATRTICTCMHAGADTLTERKDVAQERVREKENKSARCKLDL
jgi:hypothetical protein